MEGEFNIREVYGSDVKTAMQELDVACRNTISQNIDEWDLYIEKLIKYACNYVAEDSTGLIIGFIAFYANDVSSRMAYITQVIVHPQFRRRGLGHALVKKCFIEVQRIGMNKVRLEVACDNVKAFSLYKDLGFIVESEKAHSKYMIVDLYN